MDMGPMLYRRCENFRTRTGTTTTLLVPTIAKSYIHGSRSLGPSQLNLHTLNLETLKSCATFNMQVSLWYGKGRSCLLPHACNIRLDISSLQCVANLDTNRPSSRVSQSISDQTDIYNMDANKELKVRHALPGKGSIQHRGNVRTYPSLALRPCSGLVR